MPPAPRLVSAYLRRPAFTLVEMLAVLAIVGVLVAILLPVVHRVREGSKSARCVANLRGVSQAFGLFAADNQGYYPAARFHATQSDASKGRRNQGPGYGWEAELRPYIGNNIRTVAGSGGALVHFAICSEGWTGMNGGLVVGSDSGGNPIKSLDYQFRAVQIPQPANTVLAGDSDDYHLGIWKGMKPDEDGKFVSGDPIRHSGKANYLFFDGHIKTLSLEDALKARFY